VSRDEQMTETRLNDEEFVKAFESCTLPNAEFHHADHVRMAFLYLCRFPPLEAFA
jgi:hypothetical protein